VRVAADRQLPNAQVETTLIDIVSHPSYSYSCRYYTTVQLQSDRGEWILKIAIQRHSADPEFKSLNRLQCSLYFSTVRGNGHYETPM